MKLPIVGAVAFIVGLAGGTFLSPARHAVPVDTLHTAGLAPTDSLGATAPQGTHVETPSAPVGPAASNQGAPPPEVTPTAVTSPATDAAALTAAIARLPAAEAGPMVAKLADAEAVAVLKAISLPQASKILDAMTPEQAARLSKLLLLAGVTP